MAMHAQVRIPEGAQSEREIRSEVRRRAISITGAFSEAVQVWGPTASVESARHRQAMCGRVSSNPKSGIRMGLMCWGLRDGTLQPLLYAFARLHPDRWRRAMGPKAEQFAELVGRHREFPDDLAAFVAGELEGATGVLTAEWRRRFKLLGMDSAFLHLQALRLEEPLLAAAAVCRRAGLVTDRAFCLALDLYAQGVRVIWANGVPQSEDAERARLERLADQQTANKPEAGRELRLARARCIATGRGFVAGQLFSLDHHFGLCGQPWEIQS